VTESISEEYKKHLIRIKNQYESAGKQGSLTNFMLFAGGEEKVFKIFGGYSIFLRVLEDVGYSKGYRCDLKRKWRKKFKNLESNQLNLLYIDEK